MSEFIPSGAFTVPRSRAHVWVRNGQPTLTIIADAPDDLSLDWPESNGALMIFDSSFELTVTVVPS
jgi:hypothetical protein